MAASDFANDDIKVSELLWLPAGCLLVLEQGSATAKVYHCSLAPGRLGEEHLDVRNASDVRGNSASGEADQIPVVTKRLLSSSDDHPEEPRDTEGMISLSFSELLVVNDNDFGVDGAKTGTTRRIDLPQSNTCLSCGGVPIETVLSMRNSPT